MSYAVDGTTPIPPTLIQLESPFAAASPEEQRVNILYGRMAMRDCLLRGEAPMASHLIYAQPDVLDDDNPAERQLGMHAGFAWLDVVAYVVVYTDQGISAGMHQGIALAQSKGLTIIHRTLKHWDATAATEQDTTP